MSTICKIALTIPATTVVAAMEQLLRDSARPFKLEDSEWPSACGLEAFNIGDDFPSLLSVKQVTPDVTEIHFNSFNRMEDLASSLSRATGANVVVNIHQSVSIASYWALHANGQLVRSIEAGDGFMFAQSGAPLPFERNAPDIDEDGEEYQEFSYGDQDRYNRQVGIPVDVYQQYDSSWTNFALRQARKPWWQFW